MILSHMNPLYSLNTHSLSDVWFENIFFHSPGLFFFVNNVLCCAKTFCLLESHFLNFAFLSFTLGINHKICIHIYIYISPRPYQGVYHLCFSHFMFSDVTIKFLIYFELVFVPMLCRESVHSFECYCPFFQNHLLKRLSFLHCIFWYLYSKLNNHVYMGLFFCLSIYSVPLIHVSV